MARPQRIEKLRHGRLLCGSVFRFFVETWNWLTAYVDNMKGDAETDPQSGYITIDRTDPDHPVIRFRADKVAAGGGGGGDDYEFLHPFEVRWSQSENNGQGAWVIWLPMNTGGNHVYIGRERRPIGNVSAAQTLPAGWYILGMLSADYSGSLWLNASKAKEAGQTESTFLATTGQGDGSGNMYWYAAIVARIDYDSNTGARRVKQLIDSTVTFGANIGDGSGGGGGLSGTVEFVADNDWYVNGSVHQLRKRLRVLDLATGQVTDKPKTTYANGWEVITDTTPISSIIGN